MQSKHVRCPAWPGVTPFELAQGCHRGICIPPQRGGACINCRAYFIFFLLMLLLSVSFIAAARTWPWAHSFQGVPSCSKLFGMKPRGVFIPPRRGGPGIKKGPRVLLLLLLLFSDPLRRSCLVSGALFPSMLGMRLRGIRVPPQRSGHFIHTAFFSISYFFLLFLPLSFSFSSPLFLAPFFFLSTFSSFTLHPSATFLFHSGGPRSGARTRCKATFVYCANLPRACR